MWAFQDALDLRPADSEACRGLARALIVAQLPGRALEVLVACRRAPRGSGGAMPPDRSEELENGRVAAAAYLSQGDALGAVAVLRGIGPEVNGSAAALLDLGNAEEVLGDDGPALLAYRRLTQLEPDNVEGELGLGRLAARQRRWQTAFPALIRARRAAPDDPRPLCQLGVARLAQGGAGADQDRPGGALSFFREALRSHPDYGPAQRQIGLWLLRHGQPGAAALSLESAAAAHSGGAETRLLLAAALEGAGQKAAAAYQRGLAAEAMQQPRQALREYQRLAPLDPARKDVPLLLSAVYTHLELKERAADVARKGLERDPDDPQLLARRAQLLFMIDNRAAGAALCRSWMQRQPAAAEPYRLLGRMEREARHPDEAVRLSEQAMARDPRNADYCLETALALMATPTADHVRRADAVLRRAVSLKPGDSEVHLHRGEVLERLGDLEGALREYQRSMDDDHSARFGAYSLSQLCSRLHKDSRARFYADNVRVLRERADTMQMLWRRVIQMPGDAEAHAHLADQLLKAADLEQARYQLDQALQGDPAQNERRRQQQILQRLLALREE
jgi:tetratricopeptide (TPR) repeat protein